MRQTLRSTTPPRPGAARARTARSPGIGDLPVTAGLVLDFDANRGVTTSSGNQVEAIADQRSGAVVSQFRSAKATLEVSGAVTHLRAPAVNNSGYQGDLTAPLVQPAGAFGLTVCAVVRPAASGQVFASFMELWRGQQVATEQFLFVVNFGDDGATHDDLRVQARNDAVPINELTVWSGAGLSSAHWNALAVRIAPDHVKLWNGDASNAVPRGFAALSLEVGAVMFPGNYYSSPSLDIARSLAFARALSDAEVAETLAYLQQRYAA